MTPTAVIVDDEPLARERLRDLVAEHPVVEIAGEAADGEAAVRLIDEIRPDIAFLDIAMPGLTGLEVLGAVRHRPLAIFTTAYDRFAVSAFELAAVDYLLKPFGAERLRAALDRAIDWLQRPAAPADERVRDTLRTDRPLERLFVRDRGRIVPLAAAAIKRCEARDDYVAVHAGGRTYLVQVRLQDLERRLDPTRFVRVHRSHLVNLDFVQAFEPYDAHRLLVHMRDGTRVLGSRTRSRELRGRMGL